MCALMEHATLDSSLSFLVVAQMTRAMSLLVLARHVGFWAAQFPDILGPTSRLVVSNFLIALAGLL